MISICSLQNGYSFPHSAFHFSFFYHLMQNNQISVNDSIIIKILNLRIIFLQIDQHCYFCNCIFTQFILLFIVIIKFNKLILDNGEPTRISNSMMSTVFSLKCFFGAVEWILIEKLRVVWRAFNQYIFAFFGYCLNLFILAQTSFRFRCFTCTSIVNYFSLDWSLYFIIYLIFVKGVKKEHPRICFCRFHD